MRALGLGLARGALFLLLAALAACGSGGTSNDGCLVISGTALRADGRSGAIQDLFVIVEVRFITLTDSFFDEVGIDFHQQVQEDFDPPPEFGSNAGGSVGTSSNFIGGVPFSTVLVPAGQAGTRPLPVIHELFVSPSPGLFMTTNLPTTSCIEFGPGGYHTLDGLSPVPSGQELLAQPGPTILPIRYDTLDDTAVTMLLDAIALDGTSQLLAAPVLQTLPGQVARVQAKTETVALADLDPEFAARVTALDPIIGAVDTGPVLGFRTEVSSDLTTVTLHVTPALQMATAIWPQTFDLDGITPSGVEVPLTRQRGPRTTVQIPDGQTVVLGGTLDGDGMTVNRGIPILADLPVLGSHLRQHQQLDLRRNLMVLVTAEIVPLDE